MGSEVTSPFDQSFLLKTTDHAILMLSLRYRSYLMSGGKLPTSQICNSNDWKSCRERKKASEDIRMKGQIFKISKRKAVDLTLT